MHKLENFSQKIYVKKTSLQKYKNVKMLRKYNIKIIQVSLQISKVAFLLGSEIDSMRPIDVFARNAV